MTWPNLLVSESNTASLPSFIGFGQVKNCFQEGLIKKCNLFVVAII